jgi:hypothetical protein
VIQTVLAAQLVTKGGILGGESNGVVPPPGMSPVAPPASGTLKR